MQTTRPRTIQWPAVALAIFLPTAAAVIGSIFTAEAIPNWYAELAKPSFTPPNWVFGPVWTILYLFQAIAFYMVYTSKSIYRTLGIGLFIAQIVANTAWSWIFFGLHQPAWAFVDIVLLWGLLLWTIIVFSCIKPATGLLLWPYLAWVTFASALTVGITVLN